MSAANHGQSARQAKKLIARSLPGASASLKEDLRCSEHIAETIWRRWQVAPSQWQLKHARWYLEHACKELSNSRRYKHWLTLRRLLQALEVFDKWESKLRGPWLRRDGDAKPLKRTGRPARKVRLIP